MATPLALQRWQELTAFSEAFSEATAMKKLIVHTWEQQLDSAQVN